MKTERYEDPCGNCELSSRPEFFHPMGTKGSKKAKILVVTKAPREGQKHPLSPQALGMFSRAMEPYGFGPGDFVFQSCVRCLYDPSLFRVHQKHNITKSCKEWLHRRIETMKPDLIVPLGNDAASAVIGRKVSITKARGAPVHHEGHDCYVLPMLDPEYVAMYPQHRASFNIDCRTMNQLIAENYDVDKIGKESLGDYKIVDDLQFLIDMEPKYLDFDIEAIGLRHSARGAKIVTMQFCVKPGEAYAVVWDHPERPYPQARRKRLLNQLRQLFSNPKTEVIGQNLKFDAVWILKKFGIRLRMYWDTLMLYTLLDENSMDKSQDMLVKVFVPEMAGYADSFNNKYDKARMDLVPLDDLISYGCGDVDANLRLFYKLKAEVEKDPKLLTHYHYVSRPALNAFVPVEAEGMIVSEANLDRFQAVLATSIKEQRSTIIGQIDRLVTQKWMRKHGKDGLNLNRREFLRDVLFAPPYGHARGCNLPPHVWTASTEKLEPQFRLPSTSTKNHLPFFFDHRQHGRFVMDLSQLLKDERLYDSNVVSFRNKYMIDGRIYPTYSLHTAVTGRSASRDPNCFPGDVEVLTDSGWVRWDRLCTRSLVAQYDLDTGRIDFDRPTDYVEQSVDGSLYRIRTEQQIDITATKDHGYYVANRKTREYRRYTAEDYPKDGKQPQAGRYVGGTQDLRPSQISIICAIQADAYEVPKGGLEWGFRKKRKIDRLEGALQDEGIPYRKTVQDNGATRIYVGKGAIPDWAKNRKKFGPWLLSWSRSSLDVFCNEVWFWDGDYTRRSTWTSVYEENSDWVQIAMVLSGHRAWQYERSNPTCDSFRVVNVTQDAASSSTANRTVETVPYSGKVYCCTMPKGTLIVRQNGRVAITGNSQNFPKRGKNAKAYRAIFVSPPGWVLIEADLSQAELRIAADMANEQTMLEIYRNNGDIHRATACMVMGITEEEFSKLPKDEQKLARYKAKAINFGYIYGMGWRKFIIYAKTQYGVDYTDRESENIRNGYFEMFYNLPEWHKTMRNYAKIHRQVRSYSGRLRHLPMIDSKEEYITAEALRQAINCLSDDTQILTERGWLSVDDLSVGDIAFSVNPTTGVMEPSTVEAIHTHDVDQDMHHFTHNAVDAVATPNHRWLIDHKGNRNTVDTRFKTSDELKFTGSDKIWTASDGMVDDMSTSWADDEVELLGWVLTDGYYKKQFSPKTGKPWGTGRVGVTQSKKKNLDRISDMMTRLGGHSHRVVEKTGQHIWDITCDAGYRMREMMPDKTLTMEVLLSMSHTQRVLLFETMLTGDGSWGTQAGRYRKFTCSDERRAEIFVALCSMVGQAARYSYRDMSMYTPVSEKMHNIPKMTGVWNVELVVNKRAQVQYGHEVKRWSGRVWCPTLRNGTWVAKRNGKVFVTGNSPVQEFGSSLGLISMGRIDQEVSRKYLKLVGFVHDALYAYVPTKYVEWGAKTLKYYMESNPIDEWFGIDMSCPILSEVGFGYDGSAMFELDNLKLGKKYHWDREIYDTSDWRKANVPELPKQKRPPNNGRIITPEYMDLGIAL